MTAINFSLRLASATWFAFAGQSLLAATVTKSDTTSLQANATNWSASPGTTDTGSFTGTLSSTNAASLTLGGVNLSMGSLLFNSTMTGPVVISDTAKLTLNNYSTTQASMTIAGQNAAHNVTFNAPVEFAHVSGGIIESNYTNTAQSITFNGSITSTGKVLLRTGNATFSGGGTYTSIGIGSRTGVTSTISIGANNGISTSASFSLGEANGTSRFDLAGFNQSLVGISKLNPGTTAIIGNSSTTSDSVLTLTGTSSYSGVIQDSIGSGNKKVAITVNGGDLTLSAANTYTGATTVSSGKLTIAATGSLASGSAVSVTGGELAVNGSVSGTVSVSSGGKLTGTGTLNASTTISGVHAPGSGIGLQTIGSNLSYATGSIFEWEIAANALGVRGTDYDAVNVTGNLSANSGAIFRVVLAGADLADGFWDTDRSWNDIFSKNFTTGGFSTANLQVWSGGSAYDTSDQGVFSIQGGTLQWTAVPEPSGLFIAMLAMAGMFRRRRSHPGSP